MFSSRTLTDRNNDPKPWICISCSDRFRREPRKTFSSEHRIVERRRSRFQYGTLPENPILVAMRKVKARWGSVNIQLWLDDTADYSSRDVYLVIREASDVERAFAHRVLSLLAAVTR